ncbi:MAG: spermidine/putrescine ABC transporter substrate-binding protein [Oscillospiraceae bacterium]|nr:spermidine/putrescine ABC transporter substrate-binding protein [Oscillospiraceae bacterium]
MKKTFSLLLACLLAVALLAACGGPGEPGGNDGATLTLNVYNWGEYISDGSEGSYDTVKAFEAWYQETYGQKVRVNYDTYDSNENMYAKLSSGAVSYDVIFPSDYMIARMREEGMLLPLNFDNIPNYANIDENFRGLYYDPDDSYSVPYTYGIVGIIWNANEVDASDAQGWELLWNSKYSGRIVQFNNSRDAFGTAMYKLGLDVNSLEKPDWNAAFQELKAQRPYVYSYVMDEIYNMMESGEVAVGAYYAGDYFTMLDNQSSSVDLRFYYPEPTNYYIDAMCIPSCCQHQELAERFINFMLDRDAAIANAEATWYASPNTVVYTDPEYLEEMGEEVIEILYPEIDDFAELYNTLAYRNLPAELLDYINSLWEGVKIN